ncbi:fluoride efflux transporter FluC [Heliophilum fasciatum]|uniref:Fluoride-specific ion channel FluC n=1 Tax=Heliophilum fasciatum TaxID=35700 RepID=A0A4R2RZ85_9FIRM|nr:CrcB family protein [Heliophilum fasciatum]MCW2276666.1 CrcB protein [Heliophilum fasciatum]TCP68953.1 CrcB protein [Heliophilum fasciatum]
MELLWIGLGGIGGAWLRYGLALWSGKRWPGAKIPWMTMFINVTGAFLLGLSAAHLESVTDDGSMAALVERYGWQIGFLGAYTTFSTFGYEAVRLIELGKWDKFFTYLLGTTVMGLLACGLGYFLG